MKKFATISVITLSLIASGCASNGGLATSASGGCDTGVSSTVGALLGAAAGYAASKNNGNSSAQNNRALALGAAAGGAIAGGVCMMINAQTVQKKSALSVESDYKQQNNGTLPVRTQVTQYTTALDSSSVAVGTNVAVKSDLRVIEGQNEPLKTLKETLILKDANGKVLKTLTKDVTQSGSFGSGEFENSFSWKFPTSVSKGTYTIETELLVNGNKVANNVKKLILV